MSFCCHSEQPEFKYEVKQNVQNQHGVPSETYKYYNSLEDVDHLVKHNEKISITKVKTQLGLTQLKSQMKSDNLKFTDPTFPPTNKSIGQVEGEEVKWKRIPQFIRNQKPVLFDKKIEPSDVIAGHEGDCYLLSSLAALAQYPDLIKRIFRGQTENEQGLYKVTLRTDGTVEEVVVDDFVPTQQENGLPLFCQPNKKTGQFWVVLLEKALAKVHGSYEQLNEGTPSDIFRTVTYAPSESLVFSDQHADKQRIWNLLKQYTHNRYPLCGTTKSFVDEGANLEKTHTYTIIAASQLQNSRNEHSKVVKLRNPWKTVDYKGRANSNDHQFWENINESQDKAFILGANNNCDYGLFYMDFEDFVKNFNQIHYCNMNNGGKFLSENLMKGNKASFFDVTVQREGVYTFELNQAKITTLTPEQRQEEGIPRSTIIIIKKIRDQTGVRSQFVNGIMKYNQANTTITEHLVPGQYIIYAKVDPTFQSHQYPPNATLNLYSINFASLQAVPRTKYPQLIKNTLIDHAVHHKKREQHQGKIWLSWQLFLQKGGFAYLAAHNDPTSELDIVIHVSEEQFQQLHFKMKKPFKGKGNDQVVRIPPGHSQIIIARVINDPNTKNVKFPPKLNIKLQATHH